MLNDSFAPGACPDNSVEKSQHNDGGQEVATLWAALDLMWPAGYRLEMHVRGWPAERSSAERSSEKKDLGVLVYSTLAMSKQCTLAVKKANGTLEYIYALERERPVGQGRWSSSALERPHLDSVLGSSAQGGELLERVQQRITRIIRPLGASPKWGTYCPERLWMFSSLEIFKIHLHAFLCNLLQQPSLAEGLD